MTEEEISLQNREIKDLITSIKYKMRFIDIKKIKMIKSKYKRTNQLVTIPTDIITYCNMIDNRIKTITKSMERQHSNLSIQSMPIEVTVLDAIGWLEVTYLSLEKDLKFSNFLNYKRYRRYEKKDVSGNIKKSFIMIYELQVNKVNKKLEFITSIYKMLPEIIRKQEEGE